MWYTASLFFQGQHLGEPDRDSIWEEQIVLVDADGESAAHQAAEQIAKAREHEYVTGDANGKLRWVFVGVERVCEVDGNRFETGVELFSRFMSDREAASLLEKL